MKQPILDKLSQITWGSVDLSMFKTPPMVGGEGGIPIVSVEWIFSKIQWELSALMPDEILMLMKMILDFTTQTINANLKEETI